MREGGLARQELPLATAKFRGRPPLNAVLSLTVVPAILPPRAERERTEVAIERLLMKEEEASRRADSLETFQHE